MTTQPPGNGQPPQYVQLPPFAGMTPSAPQLPAPAPAPTSPPPAAQPPNNPQPTSPATPAPARPGMQRPAQPTQPQQPQTPANQPATNGEPPSTKNDWILLVLGLSPICCLFYIGFVPAGVGSIWAWVKIREHKEYNGKVPGTLWVYLALNVIMTGLSIISFVWFTIFSFVQA